MGKNINGVLRELAKKGPLEEMQLECLAIDDEFFDILTSFDKLTIEYASPEEFKELKKSIVWPTTLKHLRLVYFILTFNDFIEIIRQLNNLQRMDLCTCDFPHSDWRFFEDLTICSQRTVPQLLKVVKTSTGNQCREIVLPLHFDDNEL